MLPTKNIIKPLKLPTEKKYSKINLFKNANLIKFSIQHFHLLFNKLESLYMNFIILHPFASHHSLELYSLSFINAVIHHHIENSKFNYRAKDFYFTYMKRFLIPMAQRCCREIKLNLTEKPF